MKILIVTDMFPDKDEPASGVFVYELTKALSHKNEAVVIHPRLWNPMGLLASFAKRGVQVVLQMEKGRYNRTANGIEVYRQNYSSCLKGDRLFFRAFAFFFAALPVVKRLQRKYPFDLIHAHMACPAGFAAVLLGMVCGRPVIITAHGSDVHTFPSKLLPETVSPLCPEKGAQGRNRQLRVKRVDRKNGAASKGYLCNQEWGAGRCVLSSRQDKVQGAAPACR